jgi:hypothetical protein
MATGIKAPTTTHTDEVPHPLVEAGERAGESVGQLAERATALGYTRADQSKAQVAQGINQVAQTVRRVSSELEDKQPTIADAGRTVAEQADRLATYLQETDARQIVRTVEDTARRQPLLFLSGAFVLGLAAARFMKAAGGTTSTDKSGYGSTYATGWVDGGSESTPSSSSRTAGTTQGL